MENRKNDNAQEEISLVTECGASACKYNEELHCTAGQITLVFADGKAECSTYDPDSQDT